MLVVGSDEHHMAPAARPTGHLQPVHPGHRHVQEENLGSLLLEHPSRLDAVAHTGFNMVLGLAFDHRGRLYVLQNSEAPAPTPQTGSVVRLGRDGTTRTVIASGLFLPSGMTFGPDGNLYVSNVGFGPPPVGLGQILKVQLADDDHDGDWDDDQGEDE